MIFISFIRTKIEHIRWEINRPSNYRLAIFLLYLNFFLPNNSISCSFSLLSQSALFVDSLKLAKIINKESLLLKFGLYDDVCFHIIY